MKFPIRLSSRDVLCTCLLLALLAISAFAQSKPESTISGQVLLDNGQPASNALVWAYRINGASVSEPIACDEDGNFRLSNIATGLYALNAEVPGYVNDSSLDGKKTYKAGDVVSIRLVKGGVITGQVADNFGQPLIGARIIVQRLRNEQGNSVLERSIWQRSFETDDQGVYRTYGLPAGAYVIGAASAQVEGVSQMERVTPALVYYPSGTRSVAKEISVQAGEEVSGINIRFQESPGHAISGTLSGAVKATSPTSDNSAILFSTETKNMLSAAQADSSNNFVLWAVPDGEYQLFAVISGADDQEGSGSQAQPVTVKGSDVTGIDLRLVKYGSIAGRIVVEPALPGETKCASASASSVEEIQLTPKSNFRNPRSINSLMAAAPGWQRSFQPNAKGEFSIRSIEPDEYRLEANLPNENWFVRSMTIPSGGTAKTKTDAARSPITVKSGEKVSNLEITIAEGAASISGRISSKAGGNLPTRLRIHLIPTEPTAADDVLRYGEALSKDGSFTFTNFAPGKYWLLARRIPDNESSDRLPTPTAWDSAERLKLRKEAEAAKNEIELKACQRVKDFVLRW